MMELARRSTRLIRLADDGSEDLQAVHRDGWTPQADILPVDRRSSMCPFLSKLDPATRRRWLEKKIIGFRDENRPLPIPPVNAPPPLLDPVNALRHCLGAKRFITLNFDYQLEHSLILGDARASFPLPEGFERARDEGILEGDTASGSYARRLGNGLLASTDVYGDQGVARLY